MGVSLGFKTCGKALCIALAIHFSHYAAINTYSTLCVPCGARGYMMSLFTVASPPCAFLLKIAVALQDLYITVWISMGVAGIAFIGGVWNRIGQVKPISSGSDTT